MVIKVSGESPFQILSTTFSIGPSTSGYDLYFSADGVNYTQLFTVGANVNRQVTQVAAGSYYKLVGNTGNVVVNWYGNCVVDSGGGGGQYVLPVASQSTLGGVKIGSGITIDSGGTISAQGGGGESNYIIVQSLNDIQDPYEGLIAYVEAHEVEEVYTGLTLTTTEEENYVGHLYDGNGEQKAQVYISSGTFHWDWENDGEIHSRGDYFYQTDNENSTFIFYVPENDWYVEAATENTETGTTENYTYTRFVEGREYRYNGEDWELMNNIRVFYLDNMTQAELEDLYSEIFRYTEASFPAGRYHFYAYNEGNDEYHGWFEVYVARFYSGQPVSFSGHMQSRNSTGILMRGYELDSEGNLSLTFEENASIDPQGENINFDVDDYGYIDQTLSGDWAGLSNITDQTLTHRIMLRYIHFQENPDNQEETWTFENSGPIFDYEVKRELYDDGENDPEYKERYYFSGRVIANGQSFTGRWAIWNGQWDNEEAIAPIYWGLSDGEYIDINVDVTDWQNPEIIENFDGESNYNWHSEGISRFGAALAGVEGYKLADYPIHIHYYKWEDDGEGGGEYVPAADGPDVNTQYATIDKVIVDLGKNKATFSAKFKLTYDTNNPSNNYPEYSFMGRASFANPPYDDNGTLEIYLQEAPSLTGESTTLVAENAWIFLNDSDNSFDSGSSVMSVRKFAISLNLGKVSPFPFEWEDEEYSYVKRGACLGYNGILAGVTTKLEAKTYKGSGAIISLFIYKNNGEWIVANS